MLSEIGVNIAPLLAGAGVVGLAVGFGSQALVKDLITGLFILAEDTLAVGEVVDVGKGAGVVEAITMRAMRLRDASGTLHTIPFSEVTTIRNMTRDYAYAVHDIGVVYREDPDRVIAVLRRGGGGDGGGPRMGGADIGAARRHGARALHRQRADDPRPPQDRAACNNGRCSTNSTAA